MLKHFLFSILLAFFVVTTMAKAQAACGGQGSFLTNKPQAKGAVIGQDWGVDFQSAPNAPYFVFFALAPAQGTVPGIGEICIDLGGAVLIGQGTTSPSGTGAASFAIPNVPAFLSLALYAQIFVFDPAAPNGFSISQRIVSPLSEINSTLTHSTLINARDLTLTRDNLAYFQPAGSTVFDVSAASVVSAKYSRPGGLGMAAANYATGANAFFIGASNSFLYWDDHYGDTNNSLLGICDPFDFGSASGSFVNSINKVAYNHADRKVLLSDLTSGQILKFTIDATPDCGPGASQLSALVYPSTITTLTGISFPIPRIRKLAGTLLTNDFFFWDETSDYILRGDIFSQNFATVVLSRNEILAFTGRTDVTLKTLSTDSLGNIFFYDQVSQQMIQRTPQGELATLFTYAQLQQALGGGISLALEESQFDPRSIAGGLKILENFNGRIVNVQF